MTLVHGVLHKRTFLFQYSFRSTLAFVPAVRSVSALRQRYGTGLHPSFVKDSRNRADDDDLEPRNLGVREVYRLLDLAATEEDHGEVRRAVLRLSEPRTRADLDCLWRCIDRQHQGLDDASGEAESFIASDAPVQRTLRTPSRLGTVREAFESSDRDEYRPAERCH